MSQIFGRGQFTHAKGKVIRLYVLLIGFTIFVWIWALAALHGHPGLLGIALLAYTLGLRHAVDADHIAAIDNVTRKLMQQGQKPVAVGFFFSFGHSVVVIAMSVAVTLAAEALQSRFTNLKAIGGIIGTSVSALFLFLVAFINVMILISVYRTFRSVTQGGRYVDDELNALLDGRGLLSRLFRPLFKIVSKSWQMLPIGFVFGLGFDTATEVALFGISAAQASKDTSAWTIMVFPVLFTAGMTLVDSTDGVLMLGAYGWAFMTPVRKLYYNMTITFVSVLVAVVIGGIETLGLLSDQLNLRGRFWDGIGTLNDHFGVLGFVIIGIFVFSWLASIAFYRFKHYDELDVSQNAP